MKQYRCGTCKNFSRPYDYAECRNYNRCSVLKGEIDINRQILIDGVGCASHSNFQSEREKVLDEFVLITKHEYRVLEWVFGKLEEGRYSDALAEIVTGVEQREVLQQEGKAGK